MPADKRIRILGIVGSLREKSYNRELMRVAGEVLPEDTTLEVFDLAPIPPYNEDVYAKGFPAVVAALREKIAESDALLFATPEFNVSIPGVLKNAIDWASRPPSQPFAGKPFAGMGASTGTQGSAQAQNHLRQVLGSLQALPMFKPEVRVATARGKFDDDGRLADAQVRERIAEEIKALRAWAVRLDAGGA